MLPSVRNNIDTDLYIVSIKILPNYEITHNDHKQHISSNILFVNFQSLFVLEIFTAKMY